MDSEVKIFMYNENIPFLGDEGMTRREEYEKQQNYQEIVSNGIPKIKVIGVGGAGNNAVNRMIEAGIKSAEYIAVNTDAQILLCNKAPVKLQIGAKRTKGLGAGAEPEVGREAAEESKELLARAIDGTDLLFITAGMGGGTGTGAAPVIAKIARDKQILTVAVVTEPFNFEGRRKMDNAMKGIANLKKYVDTLVIIPNEKIRTVVDKSATVNEAFAVADDVLRQGIRGIADLIVTPGLINCDFADVRTILKDRGLAHMGVGVAKGENRITEAVKLAVNSPLLETTIEGATGIIINVVGGKDLTLEEVTKAMELIHGVVDYNAMIIPGACIDPAIQDEVEVTVIATGFPSAEEGNTQEAVRAEAQTSAFNPNYPKPQQPRPYAQAPSANPYAQQPANPYAQASSANPYAQQPANPYAQAPSVNPYAQQPANPYAQAPSANPYAQQPANPSAEREAPLPDDDIEDDASDAQDSKLPPFVRRLLGKKK